MADFLNKNRVIEERDRIKGSLFGFFVGDTLGVPVEFVGREDLKRKAVSKMLEYGTHNQPIGTWSDDSSMVIATLESLVEKRSIDGHDIMRNFMKWYYQGEYTPWGRVFDIGNTTAVALSKYKKDSSNFACGLDNVRSNGNGSLMRILPVSLYLKYTDDRIYDVVKMISSMTHAHIYSVFSCLIYTVLINECLKGLGVKKAYVNMQQIIKGVLDHEKSHILGDVKDLRDVFGRLIYDDISTLSEDDIRSTGYVVDSLEACVWCLLNTDSYKSAVLCAVNLGEDTDTVGALTGGLAGLVYGYDGIPKDWINVLRQKEYLADLVDRFNEMLDGKKHENAVYLWQNSLGGINRYLKGEPAIIEKGKKATPDSWKNTPFSRTKRIECDIVLAEEDFKVLSMDHIPEAMEDHWFMYCDESSINYFRSWTGIQIFKGHYRLNDGVCTIYSLEINDNTDEYREPNIEKSLKMFNDLVLEECRMYSL